MSKRRRWGWRLLAVVLAGGLAWAAVSRDRGRRDGRRQLAAEAVATDATDPGWRWDDLEAGRRIPPPERNSAAVIARVTAALPDGWPTDWMTPVPLPPNRRPPAALVATTRYHLSHARPAVLLARTLKDHPDGNRPVALAADWVHTDLSAVQDTRVAAGLLLHDAVLAVADDDPALAADILLAHLNAARSVGDEPVLISQLVRLACRGTAARSAERVLGQRDLPEPRLAALQAAWAADADEPLLLYGLRGERAGIDVLMGNLQAGRVTPAAVADAVPVPRFWQTRLGWWLYQSRLADDRAAGHRWLSWAVAAAGRPVHEQPAAFRDPPPVPEEYLLSRQLMPAVHKVAHAHWRGVAQARCVAVALACERFRLRTGQWPATLDAIPKDLLPAVPLDPYTGKSLRYRRLADGVAVYSVGRNGTDDGGDTDDPGHPDPADVGIRLYDPAARGLPADPTDPPPGDGP